jgi:site-specific recombinase XerC
METTQQTLLARTTIEKSKLDFIPDWANQFYQSKRVEGISTYRLTFYKQQPSHFFKYCQAQVITRYDEITPNAIRQFLLWHEETGHKPGGLHAAYRVLRTFLLWYENEVEPKNWRNPIHKAKAPKIPTLPLEPVNLSDVSAMVNTCKANSFLDYRDKALIMFLLVTGARAREVLQIDVQDIDLVSGAINIHRGKG